MAKKKNFLNNATALRTKAFRDKAQANHFLDKLKIRDLKRQCIIRGAPFELIAQGSVSPLQTFFITNFNVEGRKELLTEYDEWSDKVCARINMELFGRPETPRELRMGSFEDSQGVLKPKKLKGIKKEKKVVEKNDLGIRMGTAKAYVCYLVNKGLTLDQVVARLAAREKFQDKSPKSISIWYKKAKKAYGANTK